jgi:hypothetical protein
MTVRARDGLELLSAYADSAEGARPDVANDDAQALGVGHQRHDGP